MKDQLLLTALLRVGCLVGSSLVEGYEDVASGRRRADIHVSSEPRQQDNPSRSLARALARRRPDARALVDGSDESHGRLLCRPITTRAYATRAPLRFQRRTLHSTGIATPPAPRPAPSRQYSTTTKAAGSRFAPSVTR